GPGAPGHGGADSAGRLGTGRRPAARLVRRLGPTGTGTDPPTPPARPRDRRWAPAAHRPARRGVGPRPRRGAARPQPRKRPPTGRRGTPRRGQPRRGVPTVPVLREGPRQRTGTATLRAAARAGRRRS